jgi:hypothetical protein
MSVGFWYLYIVEVVMDRESHADQMSPDDVESR